MVTIWTYISMSGAEETRNSRFSTGDHHSIYIICATIFQKRWGETKTSIDYKGVLGWTLELEKWSILMSAQEQDSGKNASTILDL